MKIKCSDLPGVGKKISFVTAEGDMVVLVTHHTGKRELYFFEDEDGDEVLHSIALGEEETREIAAQLLGVNSQPMQIDTMKTFSKQLVMEWVELKDGSPLVGKSLQQLDIRQKTGANVMAIVRGKSAEDMLVNPPPEEEFQAGDTVMAAGNANQISAFVKFCRGEGA